MAIRHGLPVSQRSTTSRKRIFFAFLYEMTSRATECDVMVPNSWPDIISIGPTLLAREGMCNAITDLIDTTLSLE